ENRRRPTASGSGWAHHRPGRAQAVGAGPAGRHCRHLGARGRRGTAHGTDRPGRDSDQDLRRPGAAARLTLSTLGGLGVPIEKNHRETMKLVVARLAHHLVDNLQVRIAAKPAGHVLTQFLALFGLGCREYLHTGEHGTTPASDSSAYRTSTKRRQK